MKTKIDPRILEPGFAGELAPDEFDYLVDDLHKDKKLAFQWGFQPRKKRRPEWAVRQVAEFGNPEVRTVNMQLARSQLLANSEGKGPNQA